MHNNTQPVDFFAPNMSTFTPDKFFIPKSQQMNKYKSGHVHNASVYTYYVELL